MGSAWLYVKRYGAYVIAAAGWFLLSSRVRSTFLAPAVGFWRQMSFDAFLGSLAFLILAGLTFVLFCQLLRDIILWPVVREARAKAALSVSAQIAFTIRKSRPRHWRARRLWNELAAAAIRGHSASSVVKAHSMEGNEERPVLFCNFQAYARAVTEVLAVLRGLRLRPPAEILTLLKRPLADWYNPFSYLLVENGIVQKGAITRKWWEGYKQQVAALRKRRDLKMKRLVAHPEYSGKMVEYVLYETTASRRMAGPEVVPPMPVRMAQEWAQQHPGVAWYPSVAAILDAGEDWTDDLCLHLIGLPSSASDAIQVPIERHFFTRFHTARGSHSRAAIATEGGVFLSYLPEASGFNGLLGYDDLFLVVHGDGPLAFGLAFADDESWDLNGMRILDPADIAGSEDSPGLVQLFRQAWESGQDEFCHCRGLPWPV